MLHVDERRRKVTIKHDPKILVPVLNVNPGNKHFQSFNVAFNNVIQDEELSHDEFVDFNPELDWEGIALRSIDPNTHLNKYVDAVELVSKNADLEDK